MSTPSPTPADSKTAESTAVPPGKPPSATQGTVTVDASTADDAVKYPVALHTIIVRHAHTALQWYERALRARTVFRYDEGGSGKGGGGGAAEGDGDGDGEGNGGRGRVLHAVLATDYGLVFAVEDYFGRDGNGDGGGGGDGDVIRPLGKGDVGKTPGVSFIYVTIPKGCGVTCDDVVDDMRREGGFVRQEVKDMFYGHRMGVVADVYGVCWAIAHEIEAKGGKGDGKK